METPIYGVAEAAQYLRVPQNTLAYWLKGGGSVPPLIKLASAEPPRLSFSNLLECYMLSSIRAIYDVRIPKVRKALITLAKYVQHKHPLIEQAFQTDRRDLFIEHLGNVVNLSKDQQIWSFIWSASSAIPEVSSSSTHSSWRERRTSPG